MNYKWSLEKLIEAASQCKTRMEFHNRFRRQYNTCWKRKILDKVCAHMERQGSKNYRWIYVIEFSNKSVYVGLTDDIRERFLSHIRRSSNKFVKENIKNGMGYKWIKKTDLLEKDEAVKMEGLIEEEYAKAGWVILNILKTGGLGGNTLKWDKETLLSLAKEFKYKFELLEKHPGAYQAIHRLNITKEAFAHMDRRAKIAVMWDFESIRKEALKYKTKKEFGIGSTGACQRARKLKIMDLVCSHMPKKLPKPPDKWTAEAIKKEALKYSTRASFLKKSAGAYSAAKRIGIYEEVTKHMPRWVRRKSKWTYELIRIEALKYTTKFKFKIGNPCAYMMARKLGIDNFCSHMNKIKLPSK